MNSKVKKVVSELNEIMDGVEFPIHVEDAIEILKLAAGCEDVADMLAEEDGHDYDDEKYDDPEKCDDDGNEHGRKCGCHACQSDGDVEVVDSWYLTTDSQGRVLLPADAVAKIAEYQCDSVIYGINLADNKSEERIEVAFGNTQFDCEDYDGSRRVYPNKKGRVQFSANKVFGKNASVVLELYSDGVAFLLAA